MSYCGHYQGTGGAWPCTVLGKGGSMSEEWVNPHLFHTLVRADRLTQSALRAYAEGADRDQLSQYLEEISSTLEGAGVLERDTDAEVEAVTEPGDPQVHQDPEAPPGLR